jgi:cytochrome c5
MPRGFVTVRRLAFGVGAVLVAASAWAQSASPWPEYEGAQLRLGREIWLGTCRECHANPMSDAPQVKDKAAWGPRLAKDRAALYRSAMHGFAGPAGTEMPPRGGNPSLTDDQVQAAVDYMVALVNRSTERSTQ